MTMTKDDFLNKHLDYMYGVLLSIFADEIGSTGSYETKGRKMIQKMQLIKQRLNEMHADMCQPSIPQTLPKAEANGARSQPSLPAQTVRKT